MKGEKKKKIEEIRLMRIQSIVIIYKIRVCMLKNSSFASLNKNGILNFQQ